MDAYLSMNLVANLACTNLKPKKLILVLRESPLESMSSFFSFGIIGILTLNLKN